MLIKIFIIIICAICMYSSFLIKFGDPIDALHAKCMKYYYHRSDRSYKVSLVLVVFLIAMLNTEIPYYLILILIACQRLELTIIKYRIKNNKFGTTKHEFKLMSDYLAGFELKKTNLSK